jgi:hypothetical protein
VTIAREDAHGSSVAVGVAPPVIAPGDDDWIRFDDTPGPASHAAVTPLVSLLLSDEPLLRVEVLYSDASGRQVTATSLYLAKVGDDPYQMYSVFRVQPARIQSVSTYR